MHKLLTLIAAMSISASVMADDFTLYYDSQTEQNNALGTVADLQKIVFEDGKMVIIKKDGTQSETPLANVNRLFFSTPETVRIDAIESEPVSTANGIYDLSGRRINATFDALPKGLYIIDGKKVQKQ